MLGLPQSKVYCIIILRVRDHRAFRSREGGNHLRKFTTGGLVPSMPIETTVLSTDNKAARDLSYSPEHHNRSKHIARRHVELHEIIAPLVNMHDNDADFFTKPLPVRGVMRDGPA